MSQSCIPRYSSDLSSPLSGHVACYLRDPLIGLGVPASLLFCQSWSTLVSLESAFNAEQEHDIIFTVTCTTKEIKIQLKSKTEESFKPLIIALGPVGCKGVHVVNSA